MKKTHLIAGIVAAAFVFMILQHFGMLPGMKIKDAAVPTAFELPKDVGIVTPASANVAAVSVPSTTVASVPGPTIRINVWAWNAQMGLIYSNGGPATTTGSLMEKHKVKLQITRQDDTEKSKAEQIKFALAVSKGVNDPADGVPLVIVMGDGGAQYLATVDKELLKIGPDYHAEIIGSVGYSRGEDALMGPEEWKTNPKSMLGGVVAGVLRDGDWNIAQYFETQNELKNNPDEKVWRDDAVNWIGTDDYVKAAEDYVSGYCEDKDEVLAGKRTGQKHHACVQGVVTWTPGDVTVAKKKGGLVKVLSTKENVFQMPSVIIGIHKWDTAHHKQLEEMLAAAFEGADQVKHFDQALQFAGKASQAIYKEETAAYWVKYFKGVVERDAAGISVPLGGSTVMNLADNMVSFGLAEGSGGIDNSLFKATYEGFGNIAKQQYPDLIPSFPPVAQAVDTSYVQAIASRFGGEKPELETFEASKEPIAADNVVGQRNWNIQFDTGSAQLTPAGEKTLRDLYNQLIVGGALSVEVQGHTDDVGNPESNMRLSAARAAAVKSRLETMAPSLFPTGRLVSVPYGQTKPLAPNTTPENRAKNRRVTIVLGTR